MDREELTSALKKLSGAVVQKPIAPALGAVFFDGEYAKTYDGELAILTPCELPLTWGVDFKLLSTWLSGAASDDVAVKANKGGTSVSFSCGRSKLKLPLLDAAQFVFEEPDEGAIKVAYSPEFTEAFRNVIEFAGEDRMHPSRMGVTVCLEEGFAKLCATDNVSCGFANAAVECEGTIESQVTTRYVRCFLSLSQKALFQAMELDEGFVRTEFEDGTELFGRTGSEVDSVGFDSIIEESLKPLGDWFDVPAMLPMLLKQANRMLGATGGEYVGLDLSGGMMTLAAVDNARASFSDALQVGGDLCGSVRLLCKESLRAIDGAEQMALSKSMVVFRGPNFTHMVAGLSN